MCFEECGVPWIPPSPNIPTPLTALIYSGTCLLEGTSLSEGRGTAKPFEMLGHPKLNADLLVEELKRKRLHGVRWRPVHFTPTCGKWAGELCHGVQIHVIHPELFSPFGTTLLFLQEAGEQLSSLEMTEHFDHLLGTRAFRLGTASTTQLISQSHRDCAAFQKECQDILIYK